MNALKYIWLLILNCLLSASVVAQSDTIWLHTVNLTMKKFNQINWENNNIQNQLNFQNKPTTPGMLLSFKPMGVNASQVNYNWGGLSINSSFNGQLDLSLLPLDLFRLQFTTQKIISANSKALSGHLIMEQAPMPKLQISSLVGSYGHSQSFIKLSSKKTNKTEISLWHDRSKNNYKYQNLSGINTKLSNAEYLQTHAIITQQVNLPEQWKSITALWLLAANRNLPASLVESSSNAYQIDEALRFKSQLFKAKAKSILWFQVGAFADKLHYSQNLYTDISRYKNYSLQANSHINYKLSAIYKIVGGLNFSWHKGVVTGWSKSPIIYQSSGWVKGSMLNKNWQVEISQQIQAHSLGYFPYLFELSLKRNIKKLSLAMLLNNSFKTPGFNDLYWPISGNLLLKPETGKSGELLIKYKLKNWQISTQINLMGLNNQIVWVPNGFIWNPINIAKTAHLNNISELIYSYKKLSITARYTFNRSQKRDAMLTSKQLIYTPKHNFFGQVQLNVKKWVFESVIYYQSKSFVTEDNMLFIGSFANSDIFVAYRIPCKKNTMKISLAILNIGNNTYYFTYLRPMPLRNYQLQLNYIIP